MELGRYLVEAHLVEGRSVAELAAAHGVHRSWIYKLLARYRTTELTSRETSPPSFTGGECSIRNHLLGSRLSV